MDLTAGFDAAQAAELSERLNTLVDTDLREIAEMIEGTPLQHADRWHGKSAWARVLDGAFTLQRLADEVRS